MTRQHPYRNRRSPGAAWRRAGGRGFTLVEMLVVMSILIVLMGIVAPSFTSFLAAQQAKGLSYDLTADLMLARNEALKRNANIEVTRRDGAWQQGWTVATVGTAERLSQRNSAAQAVTVSGAPTSITFDVNGRVSSPESGVRITISARDSSRCVELDLSGRARALVGACS